MPRKSPSDDLADIKSRARVAVRAPDGRALAPCHPARARALVRRGRASLIRHNPPVIRLHALEEP